jgi:hypothetical protein
MPLNPIAPTFSFWLAANPRASPAGRIVKAARFRDSRRVIPADFFGSCRSLPPVCRDGMPQDQA